VRAYNTRIGQIPEVFVASFMELKRRDLFKVAEEDQQPVQVGFKDTAPERRD
jgi:hypothetical protein